MHDSLTEDDRALHRLLVLNREMMRLPLDERRKLETHPVKPGGIGRRASQHNQSWHTNGGSCCVSR